MNRTRVNVVLLKKVGDVKFGMKRTDVRDTLGKYKEFKKTKDAENTADDFGYCHVFYDSKNKCEAIELFDECDVYIDSKKIFPASLDSIKREIGEIDDSGINQRNSVGLTFNGDKVKSILFGKPSYYPAKDKSPVKKDDKKKKLFVKNESDESRLTQFYDDLKARLDSENPSVHSVGTGIQNPTIWRNMAVKSCDRLKDDCCKHIILDIYCKIIPLDHDYVAGHMGQMRSDIDSMLSNKGVTATQYLTSASESTNAPLLDFILRSCDAIRSTYMEEADKKLKDAKDNDLNTPEPDAPSVDDKDVENQLVDIEKDTEYSSFIDELRDKTIKKIVNDISHIINSKKEENDMAFKPKTESVEESTMSVALDYISTMLIKEGVELNQNMNDEVIGLAIREATMNAIDQVFDMPGSGLKEFKSMINYGRGILINESAMSYFIEETAQQRYEPLYKETNGCKYDVANYEKIDKNGNKTPMTDQEAKEVLDPDGYKNYQNKGRINK